MTPSPKPESLELKERAETLRALCEGSFKRRGELEAIEWKINFSLWTALVLAAWALHNKPEHLRGWSVLLFGLLVAVHFYIVHRFNTQEQQAVDFALSYLTELEKLMGFQRKPTRRTKLWWWYVVEVGPTIFLAAVAVRLVW